MSAYNADPVMGKVLGDYRIDGLLGVGAMGRVYRATRLRLGQQVAIKLLEPYLATDADFRARFEREWRLAASLNHPNVIPIFDAGEVDGHLYLAMLPVEGGDLGQLLKEHGPLDPRRAISIVAQVANALDAAHGRGLVHRDVKPGNILLASGQAADGDDHVYLADFGLTKHAGSQSRLTRVGTFVGTYAYAAPEQFGTGEVGPPADIYALGCVLYECLTGRVPFDADSDAALMRAHLYEPIPSVRARRPELPAGLDAAIAGATAKDPAQRFTSARAFVTQARAGLDPRSDAITEPVGPPPAALPPTVVRPPEVDDHGWQAQGTTTPPPPPPPPPAVGQAWPQQPGWPQQQTGSGWDQRQIYGWNQQPQSGADPQRPGSYPPPPPPRFPDRAGPDRRVLYVVGALVLLAVLGAGGLFALAGGIGPRPTATRVGDASLRPGVTPGTSSSAPVTPSSATTATPLPPTPTPSPTPTPAGPSPSLPTRTANPATPPVASSFPGEILAQSFTDAADPMYVGDQVVDSLLTATYEVLPEGDGIFGYYEVTLFEEGTWWATGEIGGPYTDVAVSLNGFLAGGQSGDFAYVYGCRTSEEDGEAYLFLYQPPRDVAIWSWLPNQAETAPFGLLAEAKLPDRPEFDLHYLDARCTFSGGQTLLDMYYNQEPTPVLSHVDDQPLGTSFDAVLIGGRRLVNADADIQLWYDDLVVWRPSQ